ncbi:substrate-binding domain-containing protein [Falsiroseomonas oryziterrae]|uniref:ABC transporter substrate-binding protein n=1 Tax=Falsiroseomonas oryziterrae TaxID=2911368 RepID=UPI001F3100CA|nr:ABC transporter substrate-binding protein [Roseomonas sp. NPKOSM-4]
MLTLATTLSDRTRPIHDGRVKVEGFDIAPLAGEPEELFRIAMQEARHAITELSMSSHILSVARGDSRYVGIPAYPSRSFRHGAIYIRTDRGIARPEDLAGRTVGVPEYQQTAALWARGMLREQHGVDTRGITWISGGERTAITLPDGFTLRPVAPGDTLEAMLAEGRIDAFIGPRAPACFLNRTAPVARLFPDTRAAEEAYFRATGFFPIMHCVAIRRDVADAHPGLPAALIRAFAEAKAMALAELAMVNVLRVSLPWIASEVERQTALMGGDPWPYGFARNRDELAAMCRYAQEDGLAARAVAPEELFHPSVLGA